jgi:oligopeptide transport system ATP-binding protein
MTGVAPLIAVEELTKHYSTRSGLLSSRQGATLRAVDGVSFSIEAGETLGLVGESGCGKSTTARLLLRLIPATRGRVVFDGRDVMKLDAAALRSLRREAQMIFQDPYGALNPRMMVEEIVAEPLLIHGERMGAATRRRVGELLETVGLSAAHATRYPHEFSGGQRQRIGVARALALRPRFVVCDEPVSALDVSVQAQIINLLHELQEKFGLTYLFIAHDLAVVRHISTRVAVMYLGKVVELAAKRELYANPLHPYTQALLASVPVARPSLRRRREPLTGDVPNPFDPPRGCRFNTRCPHAQAVCRDAEPPLVEVRPGHFAACHLVPPVTPSPGSLEPPSRA